TNKKLKRSWRSIEIRYTIPEELEHGAFVGNIAEDLGLNLRELSARKFRLVSEERTQYLEVNSENGIVFVNERIDREQLCQSSTCSLSFEVIVKNPLEVHRVAVEILDINDNSPSFPKSDFFLEIAEFIAPGARFLLASAYDPDVGKNAIRTYQISSNEYFNLNVQVTSDGKIICELLLEKPLDRERQSEFKLTLTAIDGGIPERSGTAKIIINVVDANDNVPVFDHELYKTSLPENAAEDTLVIKINAIDVDEGSNGAVKYYFSNHASQRVRELFSLEPETGEIRVKGVLDFEESNGYELAVQAMDSGAPTMTGHTKVMVSILDMNDNAPEIKVTLLSNTIPENAESGTLIALISVTDRDSGKNGEVHCQIPTNIPFKLHLTSKNHCRLVSSGVLDRETISTYNILVSTWDAGSPPLLTNKTIMVSVSDINDNAPRFTQPSYTVYVSENNAPGASIFTVTALDPDLDQNAHVSYSVLPTRVMEIPVSTYISINSNTGNIHALQSFDYEQQKTFQFQVQAKDSGVPPLWSKCAVKVIILDQNDNAPVIISPLAWNGSISIGLKSQSIYPGYLVTKIIATDADSGQNARLSYRLVKATDSSLFSVGLFSGEVKTIRRYLDKDAAAQVLSIRVNDNGQPSLSVSVTVSFSVATNATEKHLERVDLVHSPANPFSDLNLYLIIAFGSTTLIFLLTIILLVAIKCHQDRNGIYGVSMPGAYNYNVCLSPESNARLSYLTTTDSGLFSVGLHSGEVRTTRRILDEDVTTQRLTILVKDNGQPTLSTLVTISFSIGVNVTEKPLERTNLKRKPAPFSELNLYLIITLGSTSLIFLVTIIILFAIKCHQDGNDIYGVPIPGTYNYNVCLSPESAKSDFLFLSTCNPTIPMSSVKANQSNFSQEVEQERFQPIMGIDCIGSDISLVIHQPSSIAITQGRIRDSLHLRLGVLIGQTKAQPWYLTS
uniref:Cadherin domain-containing protein n=1 Tax=Callorhinchus milii TaxID=7868 RepID=A0A4W3K9Y4_CALMI